VPGLSLGTDLEDTHAPHIQVARSSCIFACFLLALAVYHLDTSECQAVGVERFYQESGVGN